MNQTRLEKSETCDDADTSVASGDKFEMLKWISSELSALVEITFEND